MTAILECPEKKMPLEQDTRWFEEQRSHLVATYFGKFLVINDGKVLGSYDNAQAAYEAGLRSAGPNAFLVKQALPSDPVEHMPAVWLGTLRAPV
jgi:hypothetical protein